MQNLKFFLALCIFLPSCTSDNELDCSAECQNVMWPRIGIGVVARNGEDLSSRIKILFKSDSGLQEEGADCHSNALNLIWTSCKKPGPNIEWYDITIILDDVILATTRVQLAEHNYCGRNIAYLLAIVEKDGTITFNNILYVTPCENDII